MAKSREAFRTISEVADWLDVQTHVLRFWESKFSQVKPVKRAGGRRYYRPQDMELLGGIKKLLHEDGMPIKDAQKLLREKGVKHVASLSQPVDGEATTDADLHVDADAMSEATPENEVTENSQVEAVSSTDAPEEMESPEEALMEETSEEAIAELTAPEFDEDVSPETIETLSVETEEGAFQSDDTAELEGEVPDVSKLEETSDFTDAASSFFPVEETPEQTPVGASELPPMGDLFASLDAPTPRLESQPQSEALPHSEPVEEAPAPANENEPSELPAMAPEESLAQQSAADESTESFQPVNEASQPEQPTLQTTASTEAEAPATTQDQPVASDLGGLPADRKPEELLPETEAQIAPEDPSEATSSIDLDASTPAQDVPKPKAEAAPTPTVHEEARDEFLLTLTKPVKVQPQNQRRASELLARLEALHAKAG